MKFRKVFLSIALVINTAFIYAQSGNDQNRHIIEDAIENSAETINESGQFEIPDELMDLVRHPIDLNKDNLGIFVRFNMISQKQLTSFEEYKVNNGNLVELEELQQVNGFDKKTIQLILPYCTVHSGKNDSYSQQIIFRFQRSLNNSIQEYNGSSDKILVKYRGNFSNSIGVSYTGEKDPGEEFFTKQKMGFDFNSFNISYRGNTIIKEIIAGDYNIEYGQGLTAWSGLSFGGGNEITGIYKYGRGIIPYSGTDENRFLRGLAVSMEKGKIRCDSWISYHAVDGNKVNDTLNNLDYVTSLQTSGYHRTISENQDYHSQQETLFGTSLIYSSLNFKTGFVASFINYKLPIINNDQPYAKFEFSGNNNFNAGWNYTLTTKNILFFGENSFSKNNSFAFLNGLLLSIDSRLSVSFLWRYYPVKYINLKSNAFGKNSNNNNENGNYFGLNYKLTRTLSYSSYIDIYSFPFLKYRTDQPSIGYDFFHQLQFNPNKKFTGVIRFRNHLHQLNQSNENSELNHLTNNSFNSLRLSARFKIDNIWEYSFRAEWCFENVNKINTGKGTMISQDLFFHPMGKPYSGNLRYAVFSCPQFDTRIYEYENDVQGAFSIPFYYGNGSRFYTNLNYKLNRIITVSLRFAISWIENEPESTSEIKFQLKINFR